MTTTTEKKTVEEAPETEHFEWVNLADLHDDEENLRESYDGIEELAASITAHGLKQPILCHRDEDGHYIIEAGHRRKRALILAGELKARVIVSHRLPLPEERIATMLIENGHRKDLNPMEQAFGLERIRKNLIEQRKTEFGSGNMKPVSDMDLAKYIGRSQVWVTDRIRLLDLDADQQQMVREGRMTLTEGKRVGRLNSGSTRPGAIGKRGGGHFTISHELGEAAAKRCTAMGHKIGGPNWVAVACGGCWEIVIRQAERKKVQQAAIETGHCSACGSQVAVDSTAKVE